ncbi:hypothetical protein X771_25305 [Mesorhizobium sp. LSJC277A00]|uniref:ATP-binding protein n=1 Tax=Mesorhizobium sp. C277A TaxID=2956827 RepID=UPI0003CE6F00|nr:ATP-binding protein [Mesorhizobium sp. LSJC277A00]ESW64449.1 hypothetical protein X771_25305 [Mesorhizobium sp. LSJC277A00]
MAGWPPPPDLADQSNADDLSRDEWLGLMLDREAPMGADKRLTNRLAVARLCFVDACIENIDFAAHRGLDRRNTLSLAQGAWLKAHENLIITGQTGTGTTWPACTFVRPPGSTIPCSTCACRVCSKISPWRASMAAFPVSSTSWLGCNCSSLTTGAPTA